MFDVLFRIFLVGYACCAGVAAVGAVIAAAVIFCRAKGPWRERLRHFGGGT
jgi:hypothetical protein